MFDAEAFLKNEFGTAGDVQAHCTLVGLPEPPAATVYKWYSRGSLPSDWLAVLLTARELIGRPVRITPYVVGEIEDCFR